MTAPGDDTRSGDPAAGGPSAAPPGEVRLAVLAPGDLERVYAVHLAAMAAVGDPRLVKPEDRGFFERLLAGEGRLLGAFRGEALIGYGVLQVHLPPSEDARPWLGIPAGEGLAKLAGAGVLPAEWGAGLHDLFIDWRVAEARRLEIAHLYATAAPGNPRSWTNLMAGGFAVRALHEKYGGHLRYFMWRRSALPAVEAAETPPPDPAAGLWLAAEDAPAQHAALAEGRLGLRWRRRADGGRDLWYARP
ncbi:hypothetical protein [Albimonas pacifica]|uniref:N-acetyltransferase domain-containing protein n=1 Tax=Albimonas pacifica TaxID=1114924 RepID=A0A1I3C0I5_9RHOB|nr:hypothetical protein [Albimonas pacifica]SFH68075.1 hypothetical protein SAMN05216258_101483 [Albimonas pacifica]